MTYGQKISALAMRFPSVRDLVESGDLTCVDPFDSEALFHFLDDGPNISTGTRWALLFLLYVYNPRLKVGGVYGKKEWVLHYDGDPAERDVAVQFINAGRPLPPNAKLVKSSITGERFEMASAFAAWDAEHRAVFQEWASEPWWM
jgi:hypothetical protein